MHTTVKRSDVAVKAGVSESTVTRALNDSPLISEKTKNEVRRIAEELGYVPSRQASLFAQNRAFSIGFVIPSYKSIPPFSRAYFPTLLDGAVLAAEERAYSVTIVLDRKDDIYKDFVHLVKSKSVDGLLFAVTPNRYEYFFELKQRNVPFVLINNYGEGLNSVDALPEAGMRKAFAHARTLGHRSIGYLTGDMNYQNAADRYAVFRKLSAEYGIEPLVEDGNFSRTSGYTGAHRLLSRRDRPSLIMTSSDREALGIMQYCREKGISIPEDLSLIGYDNLSPAMDISPSLTTVHNPVREAGWVAMELMLDLIEGKLQSPVQKWLETDFVIRESTTHVQYPEGFSSW